MSTENILPSIENEQLSENYQEELEQEVDYSTLSKDELLALANKLADETDIQLAFNTIKKVKASLDEYSDQEKSVALDKFIAEGGEEADFEFKAAPEFLGFDTTFRQIKDKFTQYFQQQSQQKEKNLKSRLELLDKLRQLVDSEENNTSINRFKSIQDEWKTIGPVAPAQANELWANYHALVNRFYNNRSIYFELKELDRKKNLESKLDLVAKAEKLLEEKQLPKALKELNELHTEWKTIGPVPNEQQEDVWAKFKAASDAVYDKKKQYLEDQDARFAEVLEVKLGLIAEIETFASFNSDNLKDWNKKTEELLSLKEQWAKAGQVSKEKANEINRQFWAAFKAFFLNKSAYYKQLDIIRQENLKIKVAKLEQAEALLESADLEKAINTVKRLQAEWKKIGPVPQKANQAIYEKFKKACDAVFDKKRSLASAEEEEFKTNLTAKLELIEAINAGKEAATEPLLRDFIAEYNKIGFVPKDDIQGIAKKFNDAINAYTDAIPVENEDEKVKIKLFTQIGVAKNSPDARNIISKKEFGIKKKVKELEDEISILNNNLEFFAKSKNADGLRKDVGKKIANIEAEIQKLNQQLKIIYTAFK